MRTVTVNASKAYDVKIGAGLLDTAGEHVRSYCGGGTVAVVTDDIVGELYLERLLRSLRGAGLKTVTFTIKNGEASKNSENYVNILEFLAVNNLTRSDTVAALGGGVVGDLAGFAAATFLRGIGFVQLPTTLLAAVDSSVGGKTAIDLTFGKNLAGAFYQPDTVLCDFSLLNTLPKTVFADGCAEVIKYGVIADRELFYSLFEPIDNMLETVITRCVEIKRDIVSEDEFETGIRMLLNFGHTIAHAIEKYSNYSIPHGSAVSIGMAVICRASACMGWCGGEMYDELIFVLKRCGLPYSTDFSASELARAALSDKKRSGGELTIIIPESIGKCVLRKLPVGELQRLIALGIGANT